MKTKQSLPITSHLYIYAHICICIYVYMHMCVYLSVSLKDCIFCVVCGSIVFWLSLPLGLLRPEWQTEGLPHVCEETQARSAAGHPADEGVAGPVPVRVHGLHRSRQNGTVGLPCSFSPLPWWESQVCLSVCKVPLRL